MPADDLTLALRIRADVQQALGQMRGMETSLGNIDKRGRRADSTMRRMVRTALRLGAAYLGFRAVVGVFRSVVRATEEQEQAQAQLERGLRNLEGQTTLTSQGLQDHAAALQEVTTTGDETIIRLQSLLLTFRDIDDSNFNRVTEAALDLAAALGQAPRDAALQLAKALEDPAQGLTALRRSGTVFSVEQTKVIRQLAETNRLAEAQALILEEVERQYRGAARAQRETVGGAFAGLRNAFGDLLEQRDGAEGLRQSVEGVTALLKDPSTIEAVRAFTGAFVDGLRLAVQLLREIGFLAASVSGNVTEVAEIAEALRVRTEGDAGDRIRIFSEDGIVSYFDDADLDALIRARVRTLVEAGRTLPAALAQGIREAGVDISDELLRAVTPGNEDVGRRLRQRFSSEALRELLGDVEIERGNIADAIAEEERQIAGLASRISRVMADRHRLIADGISELDRVLLAQPPIGVDEMTAELERRRAAVTELEAEAERLADVQAFLRAGQRSQVRARGRPAAGAGEGGDTPAALSQDQIRAAETASDQIEAILARSQDRLAQLTLDRIALIDREERLAVAELRRLGETKGVDAATVEAAITATAKAAAAERHQVRVEALAADHDALVASFEAAAQAREDAARRAADAERDLEGREVELGLTGQFEAAIRAANRWRDAQLAAIETVGAGHEGLRARVEAVHAAMVEAARVASREQQVAGEGWIEGVRAALVELRQESTDAAAFAREQTIDAFRSMEDAIAEFVTTGKVSFSSFVDSVIADLARLAARRAITIPLANALFDALPGLFEGAGDAGGADAFRRLQAGVGHTGGTVGAAGGVSRSVPAAIFAGAARYHAGGVAGLRPDEVPIIAQAGETILPRGAQIAAPSIDITFENRGTPQREVSREVRLDPRGLIVNVVTEDLDGGGPASQAIARRFGLRDAVA